MQLFLATGAPAAEIHARNRGQASFECPRSSDLLWARGVWRFERRYPEQGSRSRQCAEPQLNSIDFLI